MSIASSPTVSQPALDARTGLFLAVTILTWASAFPAIRAGLQSFGPVELGAARFAIAAIPAALFLIMTRPQLPNWGDSLRFVAGGLFHVALYTILLNIGEQTVSAGAAAFIININPIFVAILAMVLLGERFGLWAWIGTALSFAGIGLIALGEGSALKVDAGALYILGAAVCTTITAVVQKPLLARHKPLTVAAGNMVIGALLLSPALPATIAQAQLASIEGLGAALYLGIVPSLIAYATWSIVLSRMPASRASNFMYCVPPVSTLMGFLWLGEVPTMVGILGGIMALAGVAIVNLRNR